MRKVQGGYRAITAGNLIRLIVARNSGEISSSALRVYLGCHLLVASREAAKAKAPHYTLKELNQRVGKDLSEYTLKKALEELSKANLLTYQETAIQFHSPVTPETARIAKALGTSTARPIPLPRYLLRRLARHTKPAELIAALGHLIRCLFIKPSGIRATGFVKSALLASVFGISERVVHSARKWLESLNILQPVKVAQRILNRYGACFRVRLSRPVSLKQVEFAPPNKKPSMEVHTNQKNNKPTKAVNTGFCTDLIKNPTLTDIQTQDLKRLGRLESLYQQAVERGWLPDCECSIRNFVAAAARATRVSGNPAKVFVGIVKKRLWHHITQAQEDHALSVLKRYRENHPGAFKPVEPVEATTQAGTASAVNSLIQAVIAGKAGRLSPQAGKAPRESREVGARFPGVPTLGIRGGTHPAPSGTVPTVGSCEFRTWVGSQPQERRAPGGPETRRGGRLPQHAEVAGIGATPARAGRRRPASPARGAGSTPRQAYASSAMAYTTLCAAPCITSADSQFVVENTA